MTIAAAAPTAEQAFAPHVADEQPYPVRRIDHLVEVPADAGFRGGREVQRFDLDVPETVRQGPQYHLLGRVGDEPYLKERALPLQPDVASVCGGHGDRDDSAARPPRPEIGEDEAEADHQKEADGPEEDSREDRPHGGGESAAAGRRRLKAISGGVA